MGVSWDYDLCCFKTHQLTQVGFPEIHRMLTHLPQPTSRRGIYSQVPAQLDELLFIGLLVCGSLQVAAPLIIFCDRLKNW